MADGICLGMIERCSGIGRVEYYRGYLEAGVDD